MNSHRLRCFFFLICFGIVATQCADGWPDFRGPQGNGHAVEPEYGETVLYPTQWSVDKNIQWKTAIPPLGLSTPIIANNQIWLTSATEDGHDFFVLCVGADNGEILLNKRLFHSDNPESLGNGAGNNSYATPSAVIEPGRVYVHYGSFGTACLNTDTFEVIWKRDDMPCRHYRGASSSPVLFKDLLILTFDGADLQYTIALDKNSGKTVWKTDRSVEWNDEHIDRPMVRDGDWRKAHSTPLIVETDGEPMLLSVGAKAAYGYDPRNGKELWRVEFHNWSAAPRPIFHQGNMIFVNGFSTPEMWSVRVEGRGVVTDTHVDWKIKAPVPKYASPLLVEDLIYIASEESFISCIRASTGETVWTERVGGKFRASPVFAGGLIYFFNQEGTTTIIKPGTTFNLVATNPLMEANPEIESRRPPGFTASAAFVNGSIYARSRDFLYRIQSE